MNIENEERWRLALEVSELGVYDWNFATEDFFYSDKCKELLPDCISNWTKKIHPEDFDRANSFLQNHLSGKLEIACEEFRFLTHDASYRWILIHSKIITRNEEGKAKRIIGTALDIDAKKKAEEELKDNSRMLKTLMDNSQAGIVIAEATQGSIVFANKAALTLTQEEPLPLVSEITLHQYATSWNMLNFDYTPYKTEDIPLVRALLKGESSSEEFIVRKNSGEDRIIWANAAPVIDESNGKIKAGIVVFLDITEHTQVEQALRRSEESYRLLVDSIPNTTILLFDKNFRYQIVGGNENERVGLDKKNIEGKTLREAYPKEVSDLFEPFYHKALEGETTTFEMFYGGHTYSHQVLPLLDSEKKIVGGMVISSNISDKKKLEAKLLLAKQKAEEASQAKSQFLANMSHEIRTPMNGIIGMGELLEEMILIPEQAEYLKVINTCAHNLMHIINDILDISKIEVGKMNIDLKQFELRELIHHVLSLVSPSAQKKNMILNYDIDESIPQFIISDQGKIRQILLNLLNNAIKFTDQGSVFLSIKKLSYDKDNVELEFSVTDKGIGISEDIQKNLFKPFVQGDLSYTKKYQGTGLGLAISKRLIDLLQGSIDFETKLGEGARFFFTLKVKKYQNEENIEEGVKDPKTEQENFNINTKPIKILIAEDNHINMVMLMEIIKHCGSHYTIIQANNGLEALEQYKKERPQLIFMDLQMPLMNGFEALKEIRKCEIHQETKTQIIAVSAYAAPEDRDNCLKAGMDGYIPKPLKKDAIRKVLENIA